MYRIRARLFFVTNLLWFLSCGQQTTSDLHTICPVSSGFTAWKASLPREPGDNGAFIVDYDRAISSQAELRRYYEAEVTGAKLSVHQQNGVDSKWSVAQKTQLSYCISDTFVAQKARVVQAMANASRAWQNAGNVKFIYLENEDTNCTAANNNVVFDVRPTAGNGYLARSFYPFASRAERSILVDASSFQTAPPLTLSGVLRHELGHTLGFRHEHTRAGPQRCYEDANWRPLTPYDSASVMHYPQCNGSGDWSLTLTAYDTAGIKSVYGDPGGVDPQTLPFMVVGTLSGLAAEGSIELQNKQYDLITVSGNGAFAFPNQSAPGVAYDVFILKQPAGQFCTVHGGSGIISESNPVMITVHCVTQDTPASATLEMPASCKSGV